MSTRAALTIMFAALLFSACAVTEPNPSKQHEPTPADKTFGSLMTTPKPLKPDPSLPDHSSGADHSEGFAAFGQGGCRVTVQTKPDCQ